MQKKLLTNKKYSEKIDILQKSLIMPSTSKTPTPIVIENVTPDPIQRNTYDFQECIFFRKPRKHPKPKRSLNKVTPTVATAAEFIEHQRRLEKEKGEKEKLK